MLARGLNKRVASPFIRQPHKACFSTNVTTKNALSSALKDTEQDAELFNYTSGRWLYNESRRLSERRINFNIAALKQAASSAVGRDVNDVQSLVKIAEGGFNRVLNIRMKAGLDVIARLPYNITRPIGLAVASEVATIDYLRGKGLPVPRIYGYNIDPANPVGAEYILMEKVQGRPLADEWFNLCETQRIRLLTQVVETELKLFDIAFPGYGSIYYEKDLPKHMGRINLSSPGIDDSRFCVGPDVSLQNWFERRDTLDIHRGPAIEPTAVMQRVAEREVSYLQRFGKPRFPYERHYRDITHFEKSNPDTHIENLQLFRKVCPSLVPEEKWLQKPVLRHPDLNPNNIFVSKDTQITGIIDWQHSCVLPFFLNAGIPNHFANYGDPDSEALNKPQLPTNLDELDEDERERDLELYRKRHLHFYYIGATAKKANQHYQAMMHEGALFRQQIYRDAAAPWEGDNISLRADLVRLAQNWDRLVPSGSPCPLHFSEEDIEWTLEAMNKQSEADESMRVLREILVGAGTDGWVSKERYSDALSKAAALKKDAIEDAEDDAELQEIALTWPYDDYDESA